MWETIGKWLIQHYGAVGIIIVLMGIAAGGLATALVVVSRRYAAAMKQLADQAEKCRKCKEESETRHDESMKDFYTTMRSENNTLWTRMEAVMGRLCDATGNLSNMISNLSGKMNGMGGR